MSLRQQAKILGINAGHLSRMVSGKRPWNPDIKARYDALVGNTSGNTLEFGNNKDRILFTPQLSTSSPHLATKNLYNGASKLRGAVAHLGERFNGIEEVGSSSLPSSTTMTVLCLSIALIVFTESVARCPPVYKSVYKSFVSFL